MSGKTTFEDDSIGVRLLADIHSAFEQGGVDRLSTERLLEHLHSLEEAPWAEWGKAGKGLATKGLADLLRRYRIRSRTVRLDDGTANGFKREQFEPAFARYLRLSRHAVTTRIDTGKTRDSVPSQEGNVTGAESGAIALHERDVTGVTANAGVNGADELQLAEAERELERVRAKWGEAA